MLAMSGMTLTNGLTSVSRTTSERSDTAISPTLAPNMSVVAWLDVPIAVASRFRPGSSTAPKASSCDRTAARSRWT